MNYIEPTELNSWNIDFRDTSRDDFQKRKMHLIRSFELDSIDTTFEKEWYWFLIRWSQWAIFSIKNDTLVSISNMGSWDELYFDNIVIGSIYLRDYQRDVMYIALWWVDQWNERYDIKSIWILENGRLDLIDEIPQKCRLSMALVMVATKASFRLSGY